MDNIPAIKTINLTKSFNRVKVVDSLNIEVYKGEIFAFLGPNGAGKTTTIKLMCGLLRPSYGSVLLNNIDINLNPIEVKRSIGLVTEQPFIYEYLTGFEFVRFVADLYGVPVFEQKRKIPELFEMFELTPFMHNLVQSYSHGMRQKLIFVSVLLHNPRIIFLDEPLVGLDPKSAKLLKDVFLKLSNRGVTIFMCTHVLEIAEKLANRIGIINKGRLVVIDTVEGLKNQIKISGGLEDIFLTLTGGLEYKDLLKFL